MDVGTVNTTAIQTRITTLRKQILACEGEIETLQDQLLASAVKTLFVHPAEPVLGKAVGVRKSGGVVRVRRGHGSLPRPLSVLR